jgi:hypothetical protein
MDVAALVVLVVTSHLLPKCLLLKSVISFEEIGEAARDIFSAAIIKKSQVDCLKKSWNISGERLRTTTKNIEIAGVRTEAGSSHFSNSKSLAL